MDKRKQDNHHIIPLSRLSKGGRKRKDNTIRVDKHRHVIYHELFSNLLPGEIIEQLNSEFFGGQYNITIERREKK